LYTIDKLSLQNNKLDLFLLILGFLFCLIGIVGSFIPIIPGPVTAWLGILLLNLTSVVEFNLNFILITLTVAVSVGILDYLIPIGPSITRAKIRPTVVPICPDLVPPNFFTPNIGIK
jgi:hypothetical protein